MATPPGQNPYFNMGVSSINPVSGINPPPCPPMYKSGEHPFSGFGVQMPSRATATVTSETASAVTTAETRITTTVVSSVSGPIPSSSISRQGGHSSGFYNQGAPQGGQSGPRLNAQGELSGFSTDQLLNIIRNRELRSSQPVVAEPDFGSQLKLKGQCLLDTIIPFPELLKDVKSRYPDYQVDSSANLARPRPVSLGLANFQEPAPEKETNLPLSPSIQGWLDFQSRTLEGKDRLGRSTLVKYKCKSYPKLPALQSSARYTPCDAPQLLHQPGLPPEWHRLMPTQAKNPEAYQLSAAEFGEIQSSVSRMVALLSDLDWWLAGASNLATELHAQAPPETPLAQHLALNQRYLLESCRTLEELECQGTALFSRLRWRERDSFLQRVHQQVPLQTKEELRNSPLLGDFLFSEESVSESVERLQTDVQLSSHTAMIKMATKPPPKYTVPKRPTYPSAGQGPPKRPKTQPKQGQGHPSGKPRPPRKYSRRGRGEGSSKPRGGSHK